MKKPCDDTFHSINENTAVLIEFDAKIIGSHR